MGSLWRRNDEVDYVFEVMALRQCIVSCKDLREAKHSLEVKADSLYEAVAQGLRIFCENDWVGDISHGQAEISVVVKHPAVEHKIRVQEFVRWLETQGRTPNEVSLKGR
jgi:hypothetical protein